MSLQSHSTQSKPLIVQSDGTMLVAAEHPDYPELWERLLRFAELLQSPDLFHTYRLSRLSLWNAAAAEQTPSDVLSVLHKYSRYPLPLDLQQFVLTEMNKYGSLVLHPGDEYCVLSGKRETLDEIRRLPDLKEHLQGRKRTVLQVKSTSRGAVKRLLAARGFPVVDRAGYVEGRPLQVGMRSQTRSGEWFRLRPYQQAAVEAFLAGGLDGGSGVVVLPCGAGKTVVGIAVVAAVSAHTLVLTPNGVAARQWIRELLDKTDIDPALVGEYSAEKKEIKPLTVTTYQMLTLRREGEHPHFVRLNQEPWGLIVYDEVHLLPAPIFRLTANVQSTRRLGLTATLVREDGAESDVFSLIGPKKYEVPWKEMEQSGYIAPTTCYEVAVDLPKDLQARYHAASPKHKHRLASTNPRKYEVIERLLQKHRGDRILIIGQYLEQLTTVGKKFGLPVLTGKTPLEERERLYEQFRCGELSVLIVSKVANVAIDLPDANVAVQISGSYGSRQEEAQRIGRLLRPKADGGESHFYAIVSRDTVDWEMSTHRQRFLTEQGYTYQLLDAEHLADTDGGIKR
jgi:DNA excision repair protein ERCC-3